MAPPPLHVERLGRQHDVATFDCGEPVLDSFLHRHALRDQQGAFSTTYVALDEGAVVAYYTLLPGTIEPTDPPRRLNAGQPSTRPVGVILVARLAVRADRHGHGLGGSVLRHAMTKFVRTSEEVGGRALVVDALNPSAAAFHQRFGFERVPDHDGRYYLLRKDLIRSLAAAAR